MPHTTVSQEAQVWLMPVFIAKPGQEAPLSEALISLQSLSRKDPGCLEYTVFADDHRPGTFVLIEGWARHGDLQAHNEEAHVKEFVDRVQSLLAVPFSVASISPLAGPSCATEGA